MPKSEIKAKTYILLALVLLQVIVIMINGLFGYHSQNITDKLPLKAIVNFSLIAGVFIGISAIYLIANIVHLTEKEREYELNKTIMESHKDLIDLLRSNRHDFANHLQVIMGFIQLNKSSCAIDYIKEVNGQLASQTIISNLKNQGIAALLLKKQGEAENLGVKLFLEVENDLDNLSVATSDLIRIVGNLLDNAIYAVNKKGNDPQVKVLIKRDDNGHILSVHNRSPVIPPEMQEKVFKKGFTTKGAEGSGLGLYIVRKIAEKYGGKVVLESNPEDGTTFIVTFPD